MSRTSPICIGAPAPTPDAIPLARKGFRPFFLLAGVLGAALVPLWVLVLLGHVRVQSTMPPQAWHAHEMIFGYTAAVIAGFLLTAVSNWTKRETLTGAPLLGLAVLWLLARVALVVPSVPASAAAGLDMLFLPALAVVIARPIAQSGNRRNFVMVAIVAALAASNALAHLDALGVLPGWGRRGTFAALDLIVVLLVLITGRIVPMFTRNVVKDERIRSLPALDRMTAVAAVFVAVSDFAWGETRATPYLAAGAGVLVLARSVHWGTLRALKDPMLIILHAGHGWLGIGLLLRAVAPLWPPLSSAALHALTAGAIGCSTLGMMARVALGHTGRSIIASHTIRISFAAMMSASVVRVLAPLAPALYFPLLAVSATLWMFAFVLYTGKFAPILTQPRIDGAAG